MPGPVDANFPARPLANSYWILPGQLLAGEYPGTDDEAATDERIERLLQSGVDAFLDLTVPGELQTYHTHLPLSVEYDRRPIQDHGTPDNFQQMNEIVDLIEDALRRRRVLYVHCRAGIGRTGTAMACYLARTGMTAEAALARLNELWPQSARSFHFAAVPETAEQVDFVHEWELFQAPAPSALAPADAVPPQVASPFTGSGVMRPQQRFAGALLGLAVGEALAAATHGLVRGEFAPVAGLVGGGPAQLPRGAWADDTALALCLADSLLAKGAFDPRDQVARYQRWQTQGYLSATGPGAGIEPNTARSLGAARWRRQMYAGSHDPNRLDPEPLARVAPVALYFSADAAQAMERSAESARTICQAPLLLAAMRCAALMLLRTAAGEDRASLLALERRGLGIPASADGERLGLVVDGSFRSGRVEDLNPAGDAVDIFECALWVLWRARDYRDAVLTAVNLGGRSDVIGALVGQIAGARFGVAGIPADWLGALARREVIAEYADRIFAAAQVNTAAGAAR